MTGSDSPQPSDQIDVRPKKRRRTLPNAPFRPVVEPGAIPIRSSLPQPLPPPFPVYTGPIPTYCERNGAAVTRAEVEWLDDDDWCDASLGDWLDEDWRDPALKEWFDH